MTVRAILAFGLIMAVIGFSTARADESPAIARVENGREFRGTIDATSNANELVLRTDSPGISLKRGIRWERLVNLSVSGSPRDIPALRAEFRNRTPAPQLPSLLRTVELRAWPVVPASAQTDDTTAGPSARVATVAFDSQIANWDADIETDGVVLDVAPFDTHGNLLPVNGTVEVELFAPERRIFDQAPQSGGDTFELVERWTRAITPADYGPRAARLQLPFGAITPELQPNWTATAYGLVHARISIPGHGVYASSRDGVRIRPWAPNRDRLEMKTGQRFLSTENMGRRD